MHSKASVASETGATKEKEAASVEWACGLNKGRARMNVSIAVVANGRLSHGLTFSTIANVML
jgi:hypothetical protein